MRSVQVAGLPLMVKPVLDESTHVLAEPLLPAPVARVPQSVQSEPYAHIENCEPLPPSSHVSSDGYWHDSEHMPVGGDGGGDAATVHWRHVSGQASRICAPKSASKHANPS